MIRSIAALVAASLALLVVAPATAQRAVPAADPAPSGRDSRPVACVYQRTHRIGRPDMTALVRSGFAAKTNDEKLAMKQIGDAVAGCRNTQGWSPKRQEAALRYLSGHVLMDDAVYQGRDLGLTSAVLLTLAEKLDPATKASYDAGRVSGPQAEAALAQMKAAGLDPEQLNAEQRQSLSTLIAQALFALHVQVAAAEAFKAG